MRYRSETGTGPGRRLVHIFDEDGENFLESGTFDILDTHTDAVAAFRLMIEDSPGQEGVGSVGHSAGWNLIPCHTCFSPDAC